MLLPPPTQASPLPRAAPVVVRHPPLCLRHPGVSAAQQGGMGTFQIPSCLLGTAASVSGSVVHLPTAPLPRKGGDITVLLTVVNSLPGILPDEFGCFS